MSAPRVTSQSRLSYSALPTANAIYGMIVAFFSQTAAAKAKALSLSLHFCVDQFESQNEVATSPRTFRPDRISSPMHHPAPAPAIR